jgi:hypothetical protein
MQTFSAWSRTSSALIITATLFLFGCSGEPTGSAALQLKWSAQKGTTFKEAISLAGIIDTIRVTVSAEKQQLLQKTFNYAPGKGVIKEIPTGTGRIFLVEGLTGQTVVYSGKSQGVTIQADKQSTVPVQMNPAYEKDIYPPATITDLSAQVTKRNVTFSWTAPGDDHLAGNAASYEMRYSTATITEQNFALATKVSGLSTPNPVGTNESFVLTNLAPGSYRFAIKALDSDKNASALAANNTVIEIINSTPGVSVDPTSGLTTTEAGGTATFTVVLDTQPTADVSIELASSKEEEGTVSPASLTFTTANWSTAQTVTVTGVDDQVDDGDQPYRVYVRSATSSDTNYSGIDPEDVNVTNTDDDSASLSIGAVSGPTTEAGGTATFTLTLGSLPTGNVSIGLTSDDTTEGTVAPASLTFTNANWNTAQTVTITGVDDLTDDGDVTFHIVTAPATSSDNNYSGLDGPNVSITNTDDDTGALVPGPIPSTIEGGAKQTFTVRLATQPEADVIVNATSSDTTEGTTSPAALTFTQSNWNVDQNVTITPIDDADKDGTQTYTITLDASSSGDTVYNALADLPLTATNVDDESAGIEVNPSSGNTTEAGASQTFNVRLTYAPTQNITVAISSDDTTEGQPTTSSLVFTPNNFSSFQSFDMVGQDDDIDDGNVDYNLTLNPSGDQAYDALPDKLTPVANADDDTASITVAPSSGLTTTEAGGTDTFTVVLTSQPTDDVSIGLTSDDTTEGTVAPASLTFTNANWNTAQTVTITGVDDTDADGDVAYSIVTAPATSSDNNYNNMNPDDINTTNTDDEPAITNVRPNLAPVGSPLYIYGNRFGTGTGTLTINGQATTALSWSVHRIVAPVPTGATGAGVVVVDNGSASGSDSSAFTVRPYAKQFAASISLNSPTSLNGSGFGNTQGSSTINFNNDNSSVTANNWADTLLDITPTTGTTGPLSVTVSGHPSNSPLLTITGFLRTWQPPGTAINASQPGVGPRVAGNKSNNDIQAVWVQTDGTSLQVYRSARTNGSWASQTAITTSTVESKWVEIASDSSGGYHLAWQEGATAITYANSTDNFTTQETVATETTATRPAVGVLSTGEVIVAWTVSGKVRYNLRSSTPTWGTAADVLASITSAERLAGAVDLADNFHLIYRNGSNLVHAWFDGATWNAGGILASVTNSPLLALASDHKGQVHAIWWDSSLKHALWNGNSWSSPSAALGVTSTDPVDMDAKVDAGDVLHVVIADGAGTDYDIVHLLRNPNTSIFSMATKINDTTTAQHQPCVVITPSLKITVLYTLAGSSIIPVDWK